MTEHIFFTLIGKCPEVYEVPLLTEVFCDHLIEEAEHSQLWYSNIAIEQQ